MHPAPLPANEAQRISALRSLEVLDSEPEAEFDALVNAAAAVCGVPISLVSLVDTDRQWLKANLGLPGGGQTPRDVSFCAHAILQSDVFEVPDTWQDERFADNPVVTSGPNIRFYAGAPVVLSSGECVGTLCVIDREPHQLNEDQRHILHGLSLVAARLLEGRLAMRKVRHVVDDLSRVAEEAEHRANHDHLTGLLNRAGFEQRLKQELELASGAAAKESALLCLDLDHFKIVNDTCGHAAGDLLLQQIASILCDSVRKSDVVARLGGDEFAILLAPCTVASAAVVAKKICAEFEEFRFQHGEHRMKVGTSIGLAGVDAHWANIDTLMQAADACCYAAKQAGRNRVVTFADDEAGILKRADDSHWARRVERALDENRFVLHGQRIVPLHNGSLQVSMELLLRMVDVDGSLIPPGAFIPSAERYHLMGRVDRWVLQHGTNWLGGLLAQGEAPSVAINLSGQSVGDTNFHRWAIDALTSAGSAICERLILEVTETAAITNLAAAASFMRQARMLGVRVALDDFGSGTASFGYLKELPLDYLKIDGQFVRDVLTDTLDAATIRCFVEVARVVDLKTVAEFVESEAILQHLIGLGVDLAQGFHLHRPGPLPSVWPQEMSLVDAVGPKEAHPGKAMAPALFEPPAKPAVMHCP
jgi:diguanylate cyclase (GGDEF)-like protein